VPNKKRQDLTVPTLPGSANTLLLVATLVTSLAKQLAMLLLRHTLAALLDNGTHGHLTKIRENAAQLADGTEG
jgi:hypothetical protein